MFFSTRTPGASGDLASLQTSIECNTTRLTATESVWGTQLYMRPPSRRRTFIERRLPPTSTRSAASLHDLIDGKGRILFAPQTVKGPFDAIVRKCTAADPKRRFQEIAGLRAALVDVLNRSRAISPTNATREWRTSLKVVTGWTLEQASSLRIARGGVDRHRGGQHSSRSLARPQMSVLYLNLPDEWDRIAIAYCEWAREEVSLNACDVVAGRL